MKVTISLPDSVFKQAEAVAKQLEISPDELYEKALKVYLEEHNRSQILLKLNAIYAEESSELDTVLSKMQFVALPYEEW